MANLLDPEKQPTDYLDILNENRGGFDFENTERNVALVNRLEGQTRFPAAKKTGTTICGIIVKDAVILGADTRATAGPVVADKNCDKLHYIADNIYCAGAGTSADLTATTDLMARQMEVFRLNTGTQTRVCTVVKRLSSMLFRYQGHVGCALVLGGVDIKGPHLYQIYPHGSTDKLPYTTMGSGSLCAMSVLEMRYKSDMTIEEGIELVADAIQSGVENDLGSGGNVDVAVVTKSGVNHIRPCRQPNKRLYKAQFPKFPTGCTPVLKTEIQKLVKVENGNTLEADGDTIMS